MVTIAIERMTSELKFMGLSALRDNYWPVFLTKHEEIYESFSKLIFKIFAYIPSIVLSLHSSSSLIVEPEV